MALGLKLDRKPARVYAVLGDGELDEGQVWEAALSAAKYGLDNLLVVVDRNNLQLDGPCDQIMPMEPLAAKWEAFNWQVLEMDGHDMRQILTTIETALAVRGRPTVIIAHTIKGKGVSYMENECDWHGRAPDDEQFAQALRELETTL
jgi:transketolase